MDLLSSLWGSSCGVVCCMICWNVNVTCVILSWRICRMDVSGIYIDFWIGRMRNFCVCMTCGGSMWHVMVGLMAVISVCGMWALWATSGVVAIIPVSWPGTASIWVMMTWAVMSVKCNCGQEWLYLSLSSRWCLKLDLAWCHLCGLGCCWFAGVPKGGILCGQSMLRWPYWSHLKHLMLGQFLAKCPCPWALKTVILIIWHHVGCRWWNNHGSQLLYSIKLFNFRYCIAEWLWSLLIDVGGQTMGILQIFKEYPDGGCIFCKAASLSFCLELVDVCCNGFLFSLLDLHEAWDVSMNISTAKLQS